MNPDVMELLVAGDRVAAAEATGVEISDFLAGDDCAKAAAKGSGGMHSPTQR